MKKKWLWLVIVMVLLCAMGVAIFIWVQGREQNKTVAEIQPEEEISEEQVRQTIVTLYYQNAETKELMPEGRMIDVKLLFTNPYQTLVELLMEKPKNEKLQSIIPNGTRVIKTELKGDILILDLSKEFIDNHPGGEDLENKTIYSLVNTLTELNEVNGIKILINGRENQSFKDKKINFSNAFLKIVEK